MSTSELGQGWVCESLIHPILDETFDWGEWCMGRSDLDMIWGDLERMNPFVSVQKSKLWNQHFTYVDGGSLSSSQLERDAQQINSHMKISIYQ